jgi:ABC-type enterochelin transport system permease subunit
MLFVVIGSAIVASLEAQANLSVTKDEVVSPITLLILILIFWVYFYPDYLYSRKKFGLKNRLGIGIILVLVFTGLAIYMQHEIYNQQVEIINQLNKFKNDLDNLTN